MDSRQKFKSSGKQSFQVADQSKQCKMAEKLMFIKMKTVRDIRVNFSIFQSTNEMFYCFRM